MISHKSAQERLSKIVDTSFEIISEKTAKGLIQIDNEASFQLQFGMILKALGEMFAIAIGDKFDVIMEHNIAGVNTCKSKGCARCDIFLTLTSGVNTANCVLELKYFPKKKGETTTNNRFALLMDIENIEVYKALKKCDSGYVIVCTTNKNYEAKRTRSSIKIGDGCTLSPNNVTYNKKTVKISGNYTFDWTNCKSHYFLKLEI